MTELDAAAAAIRLATEVLDKDQELQALYTLQSEVDAPAPLPQEASALPRQPAKDILNEYLQERGRRNRRPVLTTCTDCKGYGSDSFNHMCQTCDGGGSMVKPEVEGKMRGWAERLENALHNEFMEWWPTSEAARTRTPETSGTKWGENPRWPVTHWLNVEDFLMERYPDAATGSKYGGEYAQPLIDQQLKADKLGTPQPDAEWLEAHGYIGTGNVITQAFLNLHNRYNRRPWKSRDDKRRTYELLLRHIGPGARQRNKTAAQTLADAKDALFTAQRILAEAEDDAPSVQQLHRGVGFRKGDLPPELEQHLEAILDGGQPHPELAGKLLQHLDQYGEGVGQWWAFDPRDSDGFSRFVYPRHLDQYGDDALPEPQPGDYQIVMTGDWDGDYVDLNYINDPHYKKLDTGAPVSVRSIKVRRTPGPGGDYSYDPDLSNWAEVSTPGIPVYAHRLAMPAVDAYDNLYKRPGYEINPRPVVHRGPWYHGTDKDLPEGTILVPSPEKSYWRDFERDGRENRADWVWMDEDPEIAKKFSRGHVYEVEPLDEGPWEWNGGQYQPGGYASPRARIVRKVYVYDPYAEPRWHRLAMPQMYRGLGLRKNSLPPDLSERIESYLDGNPDDDLHYDLLNHLDREGEGLGTWWSRDRDVASEYVRNGFGPPDYEYEVILGADWDGQGGYSPLTNEDRDFEDDHVNAAIRRNHEMQVGDIRIRRRDGDWSTVPGSSGRWASRRTAMPAPPPEGLHFKYHHTNDSIPAGYSGVTQGGSHTFLAPAVAAYVGDKPVGYVEWWPTDRYPNASQHYRYMDKGKPGEVYYIYVRPEFRRHSIATEMFDWAKQNAEPDLHHSPKRSELGKQWIGYEQGRELERAASAIRQAQRILAMPQIDAYDPGAEDTDDYLPPDQAKPRQGKWYHVSPTRLEVGSKLTPGGGDTPWIGTGIQPERHNWVWMDDGENIESWQYGMLASLVGKGEENPWVYVYEIQPDEGPYPWNGTGYHGHVSPSATVIAEVPTGKYNIISRRHTVAAKTQNGILADETIDRVRGEFSDWWDQQNHDERLAEGHYTPNSARDAAHYWSNVESFLKDRYPAAHRGLDYGYEQARPLLKQKNDRFWGDVPDADPYEAGPEAIDRYGYDPAEIAAASLYLHNEGRWNRREFQNADRGLLMKVIRQRHKMQQEYDSKPRQLELPLDLQRAAAAIREAQWVLEAMADTTRWHPQIKHDGESRTNLRRNFGTYFIRVPEKGSVLGKMIGKLDYTIYPSKTVPEAYIDAIFVHPEYRRQGVAQAFVERLNKDFPDHRINPGATTPEGSAFTQRLRDIVPGADDVLVPDYEPEILDDEDTEFFNSDQQQLLVNAARDKPNREASHRTAMPAPAPKGLRFEHTKPVHPHADYLGRVEAYVDDHPVGHIEWLKEGNPLSLVTDRKPGEVSFVFVHPNYRRQSIATEMFDWAKKHVAPDLHHSERRTDLGEKWIGYEQSRELEKAAAAIRQAQQVLAATVNQDVVKRLDGEFKEWWKNTGYTWDFDERGDDEERGPIGNWPTIEEFLEERYPAAHRGLMMGQEHARPLLDGVGRYDEDPNEPDQRNFNMLQITYGDNVAPYETGSEAVSQHGYDPREVAAAMLLLHNKSHPLRKYRAPEDQARVEEIARKREEEFANADIDVLHDIVQKRHKQHQHYLNNAAEAIKEAQRILAMPAKDAYDDEPFYYDGAEEGERIHDYAPPDAPKLYAENSTGKWYHTTPHKLEVGSTLTPRGGASPWQTELAKRRNAKDWVWMDTDEGIQDWFYATGRKLNNDPDNFVPMYLYEVQPDEGPYPWNGTGSQGHVSPSATVTAEIPIHYWTHGNSEPQILWPEGHDWHIPPEELAELDAIIPFSGEGDGEELEWEEDSRGRK